MNADLSKGSFSGSDFTGANLTGADLSSADFIDAIITPEQLKTVKSRIFYAKKKSPSLSLCISPHHVERK